jgi:hypothetical protein
MVPNPSRRRILAVCGTLVGSLSVGQMLTTGSTESKAANRTTNSDGWPMEQHDPGGTSYAPDASPPKDGVRIRWKQQVETLLGFAYLSTPIVANGLVYGVGQELVCADAANWEHPVPGRKNTASYSTARSPALLVSAAVRSAGPIGRRISNHSRTPAKLASYKGTRSVAVRRHHSSGNTESSPPECSCGRSPGQRQRCCAPCRYRRHLSPPRLIHDRGHPPRLCIIR